MIKEYKLKNGETRYKFQIYLGTDPLTGKQRRTTRRGFKTRREANLERSRLMLKRERKEVIRKEPKTYQEVYDLWMPIYENSVEESTYVKTEGIFRNHILPSLGKYLIDRIDVNMCQQALHTWFNKLKKFNMVKSYAARVFDFALKQDIIQTNPFDRVEPLIRKKEISLESPDKEENYYTGEQLNEFLACAEKESNRQAFVLFRLLAYSGMRKGEALALTWNDICLDTNVIQINKALSRGKNSRLYLKPPKTGDNRSIDMDDETIEILRKWKLEQKKLLFKFGIKTSTSRQLVFANNKNEFLQPSKTREWILPVQEKYNLKKITTHGLRHTHTSLLIHSKSSIETVQDRLGHSDFQTTYNIYTHVTKEAKIETINRFANYLNARKRKQ